MGNGNRWGGLIRTRSDSRCLSRQGNRRWRRSVAMRQDCNDTWLWWVVSRSTVAVGSSGPARYRVGVRWEDWLGVSRGLPLRASLLTATAM